MYPRYWVSRGFFLLKEKLYFKSFCGNKCQRSFPEAVNFYKNRHVLKNNIEDNVLKAYLKILTHKVKYTTMIKLGIRVTLVEIFFIIINELCRCLHYNNLFNINQQFQIM